MKSCRKGLIRDLEVRKQNVLFVVVAVVVVIVSFILPLKEKGNGRVAD